MVTDFQVSAHLVMGEWVVLGRGRVRAPDGTAEWADLLRVQVSPHGWSEQHDPVDVLALVLAELTG